MRRPIQRQRVGIDHLEPSGIGGGDLFQRGQAAGVFLDGQHTARTLGQEPARQAAGAGADLQHIAAR